MLLKNELAKYEVFYMYREQACRPNEKRDEEESVKSKIVEAVQESNVVINDDDDETKSKRDVYLEEILEKLNADYFSQSEPHEIFYIF